MSRGGRGGGRGDGGRDGGNLQFRGHPSGGQKYCNDCNRAGHTTQDCYHNKSGTQNQGTGKFCEPQQKGGKFCKYCNRSGHNTEDCRTNHNSNKQSQFLSPNQSQIQQIGFPQNPQVLEYNDIPIQINDPCQLCYQTGHGARKCPTLNYFLPPPPQAGTYHPQTYQPSSTSTSTSTSTISSLSEEISTPPRPSYRIPARYLPEHRIARWQYRYGYLQTEVACERLKMRDRDGDIIMENAWQCAQCLVPARGEDGWERWGGALLVCSEPRLRVVWDGYCWKGE